MRIQRYLSVLLAALLVVGALALTACGGGGTTDATSDKTEPAAKPTVSGELNIEGSDTLVNLSNAWAEAFMDANPDADITVKGGGSGTGIAALINGTVDFANASREMKDEEKTEAQGKGIEPVETTVARDGIAVIVNPANKVTKLTSEQLGKIYRGEITNWKDVGGEDKPISLLSRDPSSGTYEFFKEEIVGKDKEYAKAAKLLPSTQAIVDETKSNPNAIGYIGVGYITTDVGVIELDGVKSSVETVLDGSYGLSRGLYMYSNGEPAGAGKAFIDWILSADGQKIVEDEGFVPVKQ